MADGGRRWLDSSLLSVGLLAVVALVGMVNYLGWKHYKRFDWTRSALYTLSEKSLNIVRSLDREIQAVVFMSPGEPLFAAVEELLDRYAAASPMFTVRTVDPAKNLLAAQQLVDGYALTQTNVVVFDRGDDRRIIEAVDLADYDYSSLQFGGTPEMTSFKGEQAFSGALVELIEDSKQKIVFTVGHGELRLDEPSGRGLSDLASLLRQDNFEVEEWASLGAGGLPVDADLLVIAGPTSNFIEPEVEMLRGLLEGGGRVLALLDPVLGSGDEMKATGLEALLASYGTEIGANIVLDPANPIPFYGAETIFADAYGDHEVTRSVDQAQVPVILPLARSVRALEASDDFEVTELLRTSAEGWGETKLGELDRVARDDEDVGGPVSLAVAVEQAGGAAAEAGEDEPGGARVPTARLVVVGDADFIANGQLVNVGNAELVLNMVNWLAARETMIGIAPKRPEQLRLSLSRAELRTVSWLVFAVLPGTAGLVGVLVFFRRRR